MGKITVNNLGKAYKQYPSRWGRLAEWLIPGSKSRHRLNWVMQDVSFTVNPGEAVGIIGINGAGKSTLLKMITGTTQPTSGFVKLEGRVAALLELGMGFHPDFTGRQNAYMAGQLLGYSVEHISRLMPEIEAFAEIGDYIDQPVRVYSSGMQVRLAFSVATAIRPDILIVDEALSVGDAYFQHKSFDRIREFSKQGTTLLIVSHDKQAIQSICDRAILLSQGRVAMEGEPEAVMDYYNALLADKEGASVHQVMTDDGKFQTISGTGEVEIEDVQLLNADNESIELVKVGEDVRLRVSLYVKEDIESLVIGYLIKDRLGQPVFGTNTSNLHHPLEHVKKDSRLQFDFRFSANIGEGSYSIAVAGHRGAVHVGGNYVWKDLALVFNVINFDKSSFVGVAWMNAKVECHV
ncbi:ABC transporter ATP-binding protein [Crenobacter sp. SG2303]|uniref:ABC transporter ATP-binding protein n=1 Tax=Crenobacter oryzisoli TaxID=3056844 RepID=A0ABT7XSR4_9NEIS|nr:ABC transporter ATP-binding protein [Crenobacter sp. SG2303]MDN0076841.1 ABC transporter ATP-binding protein [Crenobacter sp. SG2303]